MAILIEEKIINRFFFIFLFLTSFCMFCVTFFSFKKTTKLLMWFFLMFQSKNLGLYRMNVA